MEIENFIKKDNFFSSSKPFGLGVIGYITLFVLAYLGFYFLDVFNTLPNNENIIAWDAMWYHSIKQKGYEYFWFMPSNSAFFPLFSYSWKILHLNNIGISLLNFLLFLSALLFLIRVFDFEINKVLLFISIPTGIFFFLPYSESFFFFFCSIFLIGVKQDKPHIAFLGLLFASLTRATAMFFIPSIIAMELLFSRTFIDKQAIKNIVLYSSASLLGLLIVVLFQYYETYEWFAFAKQQMRHWRHNFMIPAFPLVSHGGEKTLWMDGFAFFTGLCSTVILVIYMVRKLFLKSTELILKNKVYWFSSAYILMVAVYSIFFNSKCQDIQTTIDSINRYIFSTVFFLVFFIYSLIYFQFSLRNTISFIFLLLVSFFLIGLGTSLCFFKYNDTLLSSYAFFIGLFIYIMMYYYTSHPTHGKTVGYCLFTLNIIISVFSLHNFLTGNWVA